MIQDFLKEIGFSDKEAEIYLALIKVDCDTILDLSKKTKIGRTTIYPIIESLKEKGFVEEVKEKGKIQYRAKTPDRIESFLQEQKIKIEEQVNHSRDIIPQIKGIMRQDGDLPIIEFQEGREAILNSAKIHFPSDKETEVYLLYPRDKIEDLFTEKERRLARNIRITKHVKSKSIYTYDKGEYNPDNTGDRYKIDSKKYPIKVEIGIHDDNVHIHLLNDHIGSIYIRSKDIADTLKSLFELAIKGIKK